FAIQGGLRVPPARLDLAGEQSDHKSSVAATISRGLQALAATGTLLPPADTGIYRVKINDGAPTIGTRDSLCQHVPSSYAIGDVLYVGPGHFPCDPDPNAVPPPHSCSQACSSSSPCPAGTVCSNEICTLNKSVVSDCRRSCTADDQCAGGQHCAEGTDFNLGCSGQNPCFCAYPGQGTMKYVTAHEFGHVVQNAFLGGVQYGEDYGFECPAGQDCSTLGRVEDGKLIDPPRMDAVCGCQHVEGKNALHCLQ